MSARDRAFATNDDTLHASPPNARRSGPQAGDILASERSARADVFTVSIVPRDLERLRGDPRGSGSNPQLYPAALAICAAIAFSSEPRLAALLALASAGLAFGDWWRRR